MAVNALGSPSTGVSGPSVPDSNETSLASKPTGISEKLKVSVVDWPAIKVFWLAVMLTIGACVSMA